MIHINEVLSRVLEAAVMFTKRNSCVQLYIVQNIYGKIMVYVDTVQNELVNELKEQLEGIIGPWLNTCELYADSIFAKAEIEKWKQEGTPFRERVWVFEKYITNQYWDAKKRKKTKCELFSKLVSFYCNT